MNGAKWVAILIVMAVGAAHAANEIRAFSGAPTCWACVREMDGDVWYVAGDVFEVWGTSGRTAADYDIAMTDRSGDLFTGDFDTDISAGYYYIVTHQQAGGTAADTDPAVYQEYGYWTGSTWYPGRIGWQDAVADFTVETTFGGELGGLDPNLTSVHAVSTAMLADSGTLAAVASPNEVTLANTAQDANDAYTGMLLVLRDATDSEYETRYIEDYNSSRVAFVDQDFSFTPTTADSYWVWTINYFPPARMDSWDGWPFTLHSWGVVGSASNMVYRKED